MNEATDCNEYTIILKPLKDGNCHRVLAKHRFRVQHQYKVRTVRPNPAVIFNAGSFPDRLPQIREQIQRAINRLDYDSRSIESFGSDLFEELFQGLVRRGFDEALELAEAAERNLRNRLDCPPHLQVLPWELMNRKDSTRSRI